ncbi:MAG: Gldg family protein [Clostridia bacterium]|nr:Gldg family protein [Clostridia bacterium]
MKIKELFRNKKFRYGGASVVFTALVITLIIVINAAVTGLASGYHWYVDTTEKQLYTLSDTSVMLLDEVFLPQNGEAPVFAGKMSIIFLTEKDKILSGDSTEAEYLKQVHELALTYAARYPEHIELRYVDMYTSPGALADYKSKGVSLTPTTVIFDNNKGVFRVTGLQSFFAYDRSSQTEPIGFYGEHRITSSVLSLCARSSVAYVTEGHGEDELSEGFTLLLESCGYTLKKVNLLEMDNFTAAAMEDSPRLVIVNNPKYEFVGVGQGGRSEVMMLSDLMSGKFTDPSNPTFASLLLFADPDKGCANDNINSLLTGWGLTVCSTAADKIKEVQSASLDASRISFFPEYSRDALTLALTQKLSSAENFKTVVNGAGSVKIEDVWESTNTSGDINNAAVLRASSGAVTDGGSAAGAAILALAQKENIVSGTIKKYNYVTVCADADFISDEYLNTASYANEAMLVSIARMTVSDKDPTPRAVNIAFKDYVAETNVEGVSNAGKQTFVIMMAGVLPLLILTAGLIVYVRRRNRV